MAIRTTKLAIDTYEIRLQFLSPSRYSDVNHATSVWADKPFRLKGFPVNLTHDLRNLYWLWMEIINKLNSITVQGPCLSQHSQRHKPSTLFPVLISTQVKWYHSWQSSHQTISPLSGKQYTRNEFLRGGWGFRGLGSQGKVLNSPFFRHFRKCCRKQCWS